MNLLCVWIEEFRGIHNKLIVMNHNYKITKIKDTFEFILMKRNNVKSLYTNEKISDSYLIIGQNGVGKTTLIDILLGLRTRPENDNFFILFESNGEYYVNCEYRYYEDTLKNNLRVIEKSCNGISIEKKITKISLNCIREYFVKICMIQNLNNKMKYNNLYGYDYRKKDNDRHDDPIIVPNEREKLKSLAVNWDIIFSHEEQKDIQLVLPIKYIEIVRRLGKKADVLSIYNLVMLFFDNMKSIYFGRNSVSKEYSLGDYLKSSFLNGEDKINDYCNEINQYVSNIQYKKFDTNDSVNTLIFSIKNFVSDFNKKIIDYNYADIDSLIFENDRVMSIVVDILSYICSNKNFLFINGNVITFKKEALFNSETRNFNNNYQFMEFLLEKYSNCIYLSYGKSSGENALIDLTACIIKLINTMEEKEVEPKTYYLLFDEIELYLHPEWCRKLYKRIDDIFSNSKTKHKYVLYITTHSPYLVSDFTSDHIISLEKERLYIQTFGGNINEILLKGMFLQSQIGEFSLEKIKRVHYNLFRIILLKKENNIKNDIINDEIRKILKELCSVLYVKYNEKMTIDECGLLKDKLEYFIDCIGEKLINIQLKTLYKKIFSSNKKSIEISEQTTREDLIELLKDYCDIKKI